jgi:hypothetical protein
VIERKLPRGQNYRDDEINDFDSAFSGFASVETVISLAKKIDSARNVPVTLDAVEALASFATDFFGSVRKSSVVPRS